MTGVHQRARIARNLPANWADIFGRVPGRSAKTRCLLCGRSGYGPRWSGLSFDGRPTRPAPWQLACIGGHFTRCDECLRPFTNHAALSRHQNCRLHHACCREHTTVPEWKNPIRTT